MEEIAVLALSASELGSLLNCISTVGNICETLKSVRRYCVILTTLLADIAVVFGCGAIGYGERILS